MWKVPRLQALEGQGGRDSTEWFLRFGGFLCSDSVDLGRDSVSSRRS